MKDLIYESLTKDNNNKLSRKLDFNQNTDYDFE